MRWNDPTPLDTLTIRGCSAARSRGRNACVTRIGPKTLIANPSIAASAVNSSAASRGAAVPALLIRTSRRPKSLRTPGGGRLDAVVVSRIDVDEGRTELLRRFATTLRTAAPGQHGMTEIDEPPGRLIAEPLVGSGDERDRHRASTQRAGADNAPQRAVTGGRPVLSRRREPP